MQRADPYIPIMFFLDALDGNSVHLRNISRNIVTMLDMLWNVRDVGGSVFIVGTGGSAANAMHAASDFRQLCNIQTFTPWDNPAYMSARINDDGWTTSYRDWLDSYKMGPHDLLFVLSVGGGSVDPPVSGNIVEAIRYAVCSGAAVTGIVGSSQGYLAQLGTPCICLDIDDVSVLTPLTESFQVLICHLLAWHPMLRDRKTKWERMRNDAIS